MTWQQRYHVGQWVMGSARRLDIEFLAGYITGITAKGVCIMVMQCDHNGLIHESVRLDPDECFSNEFVTLQLSDIDVLIDLALDNNQEQWFLELTERRKETAGYIQSSMELYLSSHISGNRGDDKSRRNKGGG